MNKNQPQISRNKMDRVLLWRLKQRVKQCWLCLDTSGSKIMSE